MQNYHKHTSYSCGDSAALPEQYAKRAVELGHKIISSVEHGWQGYYHGTFELAKQYNLKFVFGTEAYWVKDRHVDEEDDLTKDKTNGHIIILAKNENGRRAVNRILSEANETGYYYKPRVDLELLFSLPPQDVFITTACVAFWKYDDIDNIVKQLFDFFGNNFMLEIQAHCTDKQKLLNQHILDLHNKWGIEMIVGLDSHYIYPEESVERDDILAGRNISFDDEEQGWYMDYPDDDEVRRRFEEQGIVSAADVQRAMDNTDILLSFDDYDDVPVFTTDIKLPTVFPDKTQEEKNKIYSTLISKLFLEYTKDFTEEQKQEYYKGVKKEVDTYKETGMVDYPLMDYEIVKLGIKKGGLITSSGRGSAVGYFTNTLCGFSKVDRFSAPIKLYPERFISKTRILETKSLPDLDLNLGTVEPFAEAQEEILGKDHAYPMIAFGTLKKKSAFKLYARATQMDFETANTISAQISEYDKAVANADDDDKDDIDIYDFVDKQYAPYIEKSKKYWGVIDHKNKAPCANLLYGGSIREEIGLIRCVSDSTKREYITTVIDGAIAEKYKFLKNDLLKVDVVLLIDKICKRIGIKQPTVDELSKLVENDQKVWDIYANAYTIGVNQCESDGARKKLRSYKPSNISELCAWIAAIRPAFKSMYSKFESREPFEYGIKAFDKILQTPQFPYSYILYQEQMMNTLNYAGFPLDECYGIIKNIAKKHPEKVKPLKERFLTGFSEKIIQDDNIDITTAQNMSEQVWQIMSDACGYGFNSAHAYCMALDSLYCAWLKANYPYEFYEVMLQTYSDKGKKDKVQLFKQEMQMAFNINEGPYRWGTDNRSFKADSKNNCIYPSLLSIKGFNEKTAEDLWNLYNSQHFDNFIEVLQAIDDCPNVNCSQLECLIRIGYFEQFGKSQKLLKTVEIYNNYHIKKSGSTKTIKKDKCTIPTELLQKYCTKETEKQYQFDEICINNLITHLVSLIPDQDIPLQTRFQNELDYLGYIQTRVTEAQNTAAIMEIDTKYSPKLQLYDIATGEMFNAKISKRNFQTYPVAKGDIIIYRIEEKPKVFKNENGEWEEKPGEFDKWLAFYGTTTQYI